MTAYKELKRKALAAETADMDTVKAALLCDTASQFLAAALKGVAAERGFRLDLFEADYNQVESQFFNPASELHAFNPEYAIVFQSTHKLPPPPPTKHTFDKDLADARIDFVNRISDTFAGKIIYCNYPEIDDAVYGSFANKIETSLLYQTRKLNFELMRLAAQKPNLYICDFAAIQHKFGRDAVFNPAVYTNTEMILSLEYVPYFASRIIDIICAVRGQIKKCLVIDLDNTIWGGVIGDDGIENIQLGHGLGIGKAFTEFQRWIKKLKDRGIIIAVCSKNNEDTAKEPFIKHPEMVLHLDDIAVFAANWQNKAGNIRRIQSILNIGFDSFVFLDDNPAERAIVRESIEGITVPELPEDPACYLEYLYGLNLFETAGVSEEDARRTEQYKAEAERSREGALFTSEQEFLKSLNMSSVVRGFDSFTIPRAAQLSQRSNQFNLRTVRYTEADAKRIADDGSRAAFTFTLADRFGDNGLICVIVLEKMEKQDGGTLFIENWFMSCRVLKRGMENFALNTIVDYAKENGFKRILGEYIPSAKNGMTSGHYQGLGFTPVQDEKRKLYELIIDDFCQTETEITRSEQ